VVKCVEMKRIGLIHRAVLVASVSAVMLSIAACSGDSETLISGFGCGDADTSQTELCDDGNSLSGDGCDISCAIEDGWLCHGEPHGVSVCFPMCGDGQVHGDEVCDDAISAPKNPHCNSECSGHDGYCGDGIIQSGAFAQETCDPAGTSLGCINCQNVFGWACSGEPTICKKTGLDPELVVFELNAEQRAAFCTWLVAVLYNGNPKIWCDMEEFTAPTVDECAGTLDTSAYAACTVGEAEAYVSSFDQWCAVLKSGDPC
jgi:cysteine-rich repeat protein